MTASLMAKTNQGMFTSENAERFWSLVEKKGPDECWPWKGLTRSYLSKREGKRTFGIYYGRESENGYVMNQRFAYIIDQNLPASEYGIKVRPTSYCKLGELCSNPGHIEPIRRTS